MTPAGSTRVFLLTPVLWLKLASLQEVYLIEVANLQLRRICRHINLYRDINLYRAYSHAIEFCADSLIVLERMDKNACQVALEVITRDGARLAHRITHSCGFCMPCTKCIKGSRIAVARQQSIVVWDLQTGHRLSIQHPPAVLKRPASAAVQHGSLLVVSPSGAKLAFCGVSASTMHLYDATRMALLGCVDPLAGMRPELHCPLIGEVSRSVFGWLDTKLGGHDDNSLYVLKPQEGCSRVLKQVLGCNAQQAAGLAFSPDRAFLCSVQEQDTIVMNIHDTHSGHLVAKHALTWTMRHSVHPHSGSRECLAGASVGAIFQLE